MQIKMLVIGKLNPNVCACVCVCVCVWVGWLVYVCSSLDNFEQVMIKLELWDVSVILLPRSTLNVLLWSKLWSDQWFNKLQRWELWRAPNTSRNWIIFIYLFKISLSTRLKLHTMKYIPVAWYVSAQDLFSQTMFSLIMSDSRTF